MTIDSANLPTGIENPSTGLYVIHTYMGKLLGEMSRDELIQAVMDLGRRNEELLLLQNTTITVGMYE